MEAYLRAANFSDSKS